MVFIKLTLGAMMWYVDRVENSLRLGSLSEIKGSNIRVSHMCTGSHDVVNEKQIEGNTSSGRKK